MPHTKTEGLLTQDEFEHEMLLHHFATSKASHAAALAKIVVLTKGRDSVIEECVQAILKQKEREGWLGGSIAREMIQVVRSLKSTKEIE